MKIGFLGLGRLGRELVNQLIDSEHDVTVWNRTASEADPFASRVTVAGTVAQAVRDADVLITVLRDPDAVHQVMVDPAPALPIPDGTLWIDMTGVSPADADWFTRWAQSRGLRYVHAAILGLVGPRRRGALGVLLGGPADDVTAASSIVSAWAAPDRLRTYDTAAKAAASKLVANLGLAVAMQGMVEALRLGHASGLSTDEVLDALERTMLPDFSALNREVVRAGDFTDTQFSASLLHKDARLMLHTSNDPLPALSVAFDTLTNVVRSGRGEEDFSVMAAAERD
jgi:3-hydroxyisobutyrate dehydrogenase